MKKNITFIGLGVMGYHMAGCLSKDKNFNVKVWNRSQEKSQKWQKQFQGKVADTIKQSVVDADCVLFCLGRDEDVAEVVYSKNGVLENIKQGAVVVDHTTTSYDLSQKLHQSFQQKLVGFVDAPVSGGEIGAKNGVLSVMIGGDENLIKTINPILKCYSKSVTRIGNIGYGQLAKMVNQICVAGVLQSLSDAISFAKNENMDIENLLKAISGGAAQSWQMDNRALTMSKNEFDFGFAIKWMEKDLSYCLERSKQNNTDLSFTQNIYEKYQELIKKGFENLDTSALILQNKKINKI